MNERSKRIPYRTIVSYNSGMEPSFSAFATNLSESGLHIGAINPLGPGSRIFMSIGVSGKKYDCEGNVIWSSRRGDESESSIGMGIKFDCIPSGLFDIYKSRLA